MPSKFSRYVPVLDLFGINLIFFIAARMMLCCRLVTKTVLGFSYRRAVLAPHQGLLFFADLLKTRSGERRRLGLLTQTD